MVRYIMVKFMGTFWKNPHWVAQVHDGHFLEEILKELPSGYFGGYFWKIPTPYPLGKSWVNCFRTLHVLSMDPLGNWPLAPSVMSRLSLPGEDAVVLHNHLNSIGCTQDLLMVLLGVGFDPPDLRPMSIPFPLHIINLEKNGLGLSKSLMSIFLTLDSNFMIQGKIWRCIAVKCRMAWVAWCNLLFGPLQSRIPIQNKLRRTRLLMQVWSTCWSHSTPQIMLAQSQSSK